MPEKLTLAELQELWGEMQSLVIAREEAEKAVEKATDHLDVLRAYLHFFSSIDGFFHGVPMSCYGDIIGYVSVPWPASSLVSGRSADWFRNANNPKRWGLNVRGDGSGQGGSARGSNWTSKKAVIEAAQKWVALGEQPLFDGKEERGQ